MKKKNLFTAMVAVAMTMAMSVTAFAAGWEHNDTGWWYATNDAKTEWHHDGWQWIDGNNDGTAEAYYFDSNGYMLANTTTPDGYTVNADGACVYNGGVMTLPVGQQNAGNEQQTTSTDQYDNGGYNEHGVSNVALEMLRNAEQDMMDPDVGRALNAKFGEVSVDGNKEDSHSVVVTYANGFRVNYPVKAMDYATVAVPRDSSLDKTYLFKYYKPDMDADEAAAYLQSVGFEKGIRGAYSDGAFCAARVWESGNEIASINWGKTSLVLR